MKTKVWAHRGASAYAPENTLEAFALAAKQGADGVELDVQMTLDHELVVAHDEMIDRVSNGSGYIKDFTLKQLKELRFNRMFPEYPDASIPTLREVYDLLKPTGLTVNVELKTGIIRYEGMEERVLLLGEEMGMKDRVIYSSFCHPSLVKLRGLDPSVHTGLLYSDGWIDVAQYGRNTVHVDALHPALYHFQDKNLVSTAAAWGLDLNVWTVNEKEHMKMLAELGVSAIITNYPDLCRSVVDESVSENTLYPMAPGKARAKITVSTMMDTDIIIWARV